MYKKCSAYVQATIIERRKISYIYLLSLDNDNPGGNFKELYPTNLANSTEITAQNIL